MSIRFEIVDADDFEPWLDAAVDIYAEALERPLDVVPLRRSSTRDHLTEPGFRAVLVWAEGELIGFAYGFDDAPGQWWHDVVAGALPPTLCAQWLSRAFQVTEVHLLPTHQGSGLGRQLVHRLVDAIDRDSAVLSAYDEPTRARALYRSLGFIDLLTQFVFPGNAERYAVMAAPLPLAGLARASTEQTS